MPTRRCEQGKESNKCTQDRKGRYDPLWRTARLRIPSPITFLPHLLKIGLLERGHTCYRFILKCEEKRVRARVGRDHTIPCDHWLRVTSRIILMVSISA